MKNHGIDRDRLHALDKTFEENAASFRPDLIGGVRVWTGPDSTVEIAYFRSEAEAREGENKQPPAELAEQMAEFEAMMSGTEFLDLHEPWLY
jgi:hypothetical protein